MITILNVFNHDAPGGVEVLAPGIVTKLNLFGLRSKVYLVHRQDMSRPSVFRSNQISYDYCPTRTIFRYLEIYRFFHSCRDCIVQVYNCSPSIIIVARAAGIKSIVYSIHGERFGKNKLSRILSKHLWRLAMLTQPVLLSNSNHTAQSFREKIYAKAQIRTIYNPLRSPHGSPPAIQRETCKSIVYCGRLEPGKNLFLWLDLAKNILVYLPEARFHIYGDGSQQNELMEYSKKIGISDMVSFKGFIEDIGIAYASADVMIFLSKFESFGNVVIECLSYGVPVLCSDIPSLREILADYPEFIVPLNEGLFNEVRTRLEHYKALFELAQTARQEVLSKYSLERHVDQLLDVYRLLDPSVGNPKSS